MGNPNLNFLLDISLLFCGLFYLIRLTRLRKRRDDILKKYKKDTVLYKAVDRSMSISRLWFGAVFSLLVTAKTVLDIRAIIDHYEDGATQQILFVALFGLSICFLVFWAVGKALRHNGMVSNK